MARTFIPPELVHRLPGETPPSLPDWVKPGQCIRCISEPDIRSVIKDVTPDDTTYEQGGDFLGYLVELAYEKDRPGGHMYATAVARNWEPCKPPPPARTAWERLLDDELE